MFLFILEREREKGIIMSQCVVPNWNLRHQRQEQVEAEEGNRSSHVLNSSSLVPMSNYEVAELTWANGQLAMHGLSGLLPSAPTKPTWGRAGDTLESIVHQATCQKHDLNTIHHNHNPANISSIPASSGGKWAESSAQVPLIAPKLVRKRMRSDSDQCGRNLSTSVREERTDRTSACASASATFCRDNDTTMMTWASFESPRSLKTKTTDEDSACDHHGGGSENRDDHEERETKGETGRSHTTRRIRAAAIHNQSERRRRDRINQKMKALQKLVPNASKTDKASMLDEVIEYLKQLQAQVQMMNSVRNMPQMNMMMPLGMQQQHHLQMSLLARMGMGVGLGMGMGMLDMSSIARASPQSLSHPLLQPTTVAAAAPTFVPPPFVVAPPMMPPNTPVAQPSSDHGSTNASVPLHDPYYAFLAQQSMNIDLYNKMAVLYRQQVNRTTQATSSPSRSNHVQGD